jgi:hypothetical protein
VTVKKQKAQETIQAGVNVDLFFLTFIGEYVEMIGSFQVDDQTAVASLQGYLLDVDDDFYFLGESAEEIFIAIRKDSVQTIRVIPVTDYRREILNALPVPQDETGHN